MHSSEETYWTQRYQNANTGWDVGSATPPITKYLDQIENKSLRILIPGAGNAYEAAYAWENGFKNVFILDISEVPLQQFAEKHLTFPKQQLLKENFFNHNGTYDLIIEQTFFCSFLPTAENRKRYAEKMHALLAPKGKLVGVWFNIPLLAGNIDRRPFGGTKTEYLSYFTPLFDVNIFESCSNSIPERKGNEFFGKFQKK